MMLDARKELGSAEPWEYARVALLKMYKFSYAIGILEQYYRIV